MKNLPFGKLSENLIQKTKCRKAIAPVIATLLLVAVSVVGGSMVFVFAQDSLQTSQVSGSPNVEYLKIIGYDTRDVDKLLLHDGNEILAKNCCGVADGQKNFDERIAIYVQNNSPQEVILSELRLGGNVYSFTPAPKIGEFNKIGNGHKPHPNEFIIVNYHIGGKNYQTVEDSQSIIQPGEVVTLLLDLGTGMMKNNDSQIKITTNQGNIFVSTLIEGQNLG